jgi:hypothetical protein
VSARLSSLRRNGRRRLDNALLDLRYRASPWNPPAGSVHWLFVATFPNGGSTALAQLLASADSAVTLTGNGEGQWLVPHLLRPGRRWEASMPVNWPHVRRIWLHNVRRRNKLPCVVIEKSPTTMVRMRQAMQAFSDMPCRLLRFSRDPYAVCSSWASRYGPRRIAHGWGEPTGNMAADSPAFFRVLGDIYGRRARVLHELADVADATISYEDLTRDTSAALDLIGSIEPLLADASAEAQLKVKDYAPQPLRNMNDRQIAVLSDQQIAAIGEGLLPHADAVAALGYGLRP